VIAPALESNQESVGETVNLSDEEPVSESVAPLPEEAASDKVPVPLSLVGDESAAAEILPVPLSSASGLVVDEPAELADKLPVPLSIGDERAAAEILPVPLSSASGLVADETIGETALEASVTAELEEVAVERPTTEVAPLAPPRTLTLADIFNSPGKQDWSPAEIVANICKLPQFDGALVSLQEGLVVAESLPETMKGEDVAAFLPQIFGRLNQYSEEMKLGVVDDLLLRPNGAEFQVFRLGLVFFAVLGKPGQNLPRRELELIAEELAHQTQK
jgi:predicted regulator of Ras-like GTPase activity (Roadblock/LC7/MglB family)